MAHTSVLAKSGPFRHLSDDERQSLMGALKIDRFAAGATIIAPEDLAGTLFVLLEGRAVVSLFSEDGREVIYREIQPGSLFGELSAIDSLRRSANVKAASAVQLGTLNHSAFSGLLDNAPWFRKAILRHLSSQIRYMTERFFELRTTLVRERLLRELLRRAKSLPECSDTVTLEGKTTDAEFAAFVGTHREAVTKVLGELRTTGLIIKAKRTITIPSVAALEAELMRGKQAH
ncbi:MAG: Crp/Fnr family transcriptional regulator [Pseudomonadota bacterium]